jgi:uncharacterized protein
MQKFLWFCKISPVKIACIFLSFGALLASTVFSADIPALEEKAGKGDADAQFELARILLKGSDGVPKDVKRSFELMTSSADLGHAEAMGGVGFFYANGIAVPKDEAKAVEWFRKGAEKGGPKAQLNLGKMLAEGKGIEKKEEEGRKWIKSAADQGQPDAAYAMGTIYYYGKYGQAVDYTNAYPFLLKAAESGQPDAQNLVGVMLENGQGATLNVEEAETWYEKAARQGHTKAQSNLGRLIGPEVQDTAKRMKSLTWLLVAANKGEVTAEKLIDDLKSGLNPDEFAQAKTLADELQKSIRAVPSK